MVITIQNVMTRLTESIGPIENTVDTLLFGDPLRKVEGIAVTFMPTYETLQSAVERGNNVVIAHEGPFYYHRGQLDALEGDSVYAAKMKLIEESGVAILRFHDHMHRHDPDDIVAGLLKELGWENCVDTISSLAGVLPIHVSPLNIPAMTLREVVQHVKEALCVPTVRVVGELSMPCSRVGLLPGYCGGGHLAIPYFQQADLDVLIVGEGPEWETPEYVRDAISLGLSRALIVVGHAASEEAGMKHLAARMKTMFPGVPIEFLENPQLFQFV